MVTTTFRIFKIENREFLSEQEGDFGEKKALTDYCTILEPYSALHDFCSMPEALSALEDIENGDYVILPVHSKFN